MALPDNPIGIGWAAPTLRAGGTPEQQARWLPCIEDGSTFWCQLFSEPEAGSDLASLRTSAVRDGDVYVVNGQKIWSTWAYKADWGILLARTDPDAPKHKGISYFVLDMRLPGVEVRPLREMTGQAHFSEVFLTDVRVPVDCRIGAEGEGWRLAAVTLANERTSLSEGGLLWGMGPETDDFFDLVRKGGGIAQPHLRQRAARIYTRALLQRLLHERDVDPSIIKTLADEHGQAVLSLAKDLRGAHGMLGEQTPDAEERDVWHWGYLFSRALTIGGGTSEVQRTIIGERLLGLPREPVNAIRLERDGAVLRATIDRPDDERNAVDGGLHAELTELFAALRTETEARAVLLTGAGGAFSAGGDFRWFPSLQEPGALEHLRLDARRMIEDLLDVPLPIVCALNGHAVGLGASLALLCDIVVMAASATISDPHVRVGLVAGDGGTVAWPLAVGPMLAKRYLLTGDPVDAETALRLGIVAEVVPDDQVDEVATAFAERLAAGPPLAIRYTKQAVNAHLKDAALRALHVATALEIVTFRSEDHKEALAALREKRPPTFEGR